MGTVSNRSQNSTTVRSLPPAVLALRAGLRVLGDTSPTLASAVAERLFLTARRHRRPRWERELLAEATAFHVSVDGTALPAWSWGRGPAVLLVHGWEGRGAQLGRLVRPLVAAGKRVVTFDGPGHGDAPTSLTSVVALSRALQRVAEVVGEVDAVVAHSVGGLASVVALAHGLSVDKIVLLAPALGPERFTRTFSETFELTDEVLDDVKRRVEARYGMPFTALDARSLVAGARARALIVHDADDSTVPIEDGRALASAWPDARLIETRGLGHRRILREPAVLEEVTAFVAGETARAHVERPEATLLDDELFHRNRRWTHA